MLHHSYKYVCFAAVFTESLPPHKAVKYCCHHIVAVECQVQFPASPCVVGLLSGGSDTVSQPRPLMMGGFAALLQQDVTWATDVDSIILVRAS